MRRALIALGLPIAGAACGVVVDIRGAPAGDDAAATPPDVADDEGGGDAVGPSPTDAGDSSVDDAPSSTFVCSALSPRTFGSPDACATVEVAECATAPEAGASALAITTGAPCDAGKRVCACALASTGLDYVLEGRDCRCPAP